MQSIHALAYIRDRVLCYANAPRLEYIGSVWYPARIEEEERWERGLHFRLDRKTGVRVPQEVERLIRTPVLYIANKRYTLEDAEYILRHFYIPVPRLPTEKYHSMWRLLEVLEYVFRFDLRSFQQRAVVNALIHKHGILAFDPGLGKTVSALAFAAACTVLPAWNRLGPAVLHKSLAELAKLVFAQPHRPRVLIVSPAGLVEQWQEEAEKFLKLPLVLVEGYTAARTLPREFWAITHYDAISRRGDKRLYRHFPPAKVLIFDEIHNIKNDSLRSRAARALRGEYRLGLSGTLLERPRDVFWPLWVICGEKCLGYSYHDRDAFQAACSPRRFVLRGGKRVGRGTPEPTVCNPLPLWRAMRHVTSVSLESVGDQIVPCARKVISVPFGEEQLKSYRAWLEHFPEYVLERHPDIGWSRERIAQWGAFLGQDAFLHQACILPEQLPRWASTNETPKNLAVLDLVEDLVRQGNLVVLFSARKLAGKWFAERLLQRGIPAAHILNGGQTLPPEERLRIVRAFKRGEYKVLCATPQALGEGYNLVEASAVVMQSFTFSYSAFVQAIGRVWRLTSPKPVHAFVFVTKDSLEEIILERILAKERTAHIATRIPKDDIQQAIAETIARLAQTS
jgi:superfamily II DNA or RNA helicase